MDMSSKNQLFPQELFLDVLGGSAVEQSVWNALVRDASFKRSGFQLDLRWVDCTATTHFLSWWFPAIPSFFFFFKKKVFRVTGGGGGPFNPLKHRDSAQGI